MLGEILKFVLLGITALTSVYTARKLDILHKRSAVLADMICAIRNAVQEAESQAEPDEGLTHAVKLEDEAMQAARAIDAYKRFNMSERRRK